MTWTVHIAGHDDLTGEEKEAYENDVLAKARALVGELVAKEGGHITAANVYTNTTNSVNLLEG